MGQWDGDRDEAGARRTALRKLAATQHPHLQFLQNRFHQLDLQGEIGQEGISQVRSSRAQRPPAWLPASQWDCSKAGTAWPSTAAHVSQQAYLGGSHVSERLEVVPEK